MKLTKVRIINFRSIKEEEILFDPHCRVLVGINESGKSNILDALSLLSKDYPAKPDDERERLPDETDEYKDPEILFIFDIIEDLETVTEWVSDRVFGVAKVTKVVTRNGKTYTIKQFCEFFKEGIYRVVIKRNKKTPIHWDFETDDFVLVEGWKKPSPSCPNGYEFKDSEGEKYNLSELALIKPKEEWAIPPEHLVEGKFSDFFKVVIEELEDLIKEFLPQVIYWKYDENQLLKERINLNEFIANQNISIPLKNMFHLAKETKIGEALEAARKKGPTQLKNILNRVATQNTKYFQEVWKEYKDIRFSISMNGDFIQCSVSEKNDFPFQKRSDGFKKFVAFLLTVSVKSHTGELLNALLLIDEPESGLHPSGVRYLRDELIKISKNNYVVYSTHSIFMIDRHNIPRHLIVQKKNEISTVVDAEEGNIVAEEVIFNAINYSTFQHLKEINIVFEGWFDKVLFRKATKTFEKTFFDKLGIVHGKGLSSFRGLIPTIELAERKALIVSDNDRAAKDSQREYVKLKNRTQWKRYIEIDHTIDAITGEDFLKKDYLVKKLKTISKKHGILVTITETNIPNNNRLSYIKQQLKSKGFGSAQVSKVVEEYKNELFKNLKLANIDSKYFDFLKALKTYIETNMA